MLAFLFPSYLKLQQCWLRSFTHHIAAYAHGGSLAAYLQIQVVWDNAFIFGTSSNHSKTDIISSNSAFNLKYGSKEIVTPRLTIAVVRLFSSQFNFCEFNFCEDFGVLLDAIFYAC
ncbi:hypothetical protein ACENVV_002871 [Vibrio cholerae]|nr:hypothetical protein [Vibrio cholerae]